MAGWHQYSTDSGCETDGSSEKMCILEQNWYVLWASKELKADQPHLPDYSTYKHLGPMMTLHKAEPLILTAARQKFDLDLDPWP